jgi:hypothetical protein
MSGRASAEVQRLERVGRPEAAREEPTDEHEARALRSVADGPGAQKVQRTLQLSPLDREVLATLGVARYLSQEQVEALGFWGSGVSAYQRLLTFAGLSSRSVPGRVFVQRQGVYNERGELEMVWGLTEQGYQLASAVVPVVPQRPLSPELLWHEVQLNEVLVALQPGGG